LYHQVVYWSKDYVCDVDENWYLFRKIYVLREKMNGIFLFYKTMLFLLAHMVKYTLGTCLETVSNYSTNKKLKLG
jgi:hypothetical protein